MGAHRQQKGKGRVCGALPPAAAGSAVRVRTWRVRTEDIEERRHQIGAAVACGEMEGGKTVLGARDQRAPPVLSRRWPSCRAPSRENAHGLSYDD